MNDTMTKEGFGKLATLSEAYTIIDSIVGKMGDESVSLDVGSGRILAQDISAPIDVPHFRRAAMDGFAVIADDTFGASNTKPKSLRLIDAITAGIISKKELASGQCIQITTGSALPKGASAVLMVEYTELSDSLVTFYKPVSPGENVISVGSDIKKGSSVFCAGTKITPRSVGVLSALGQKNIRVKKQPRIAYFSTGNEIISQEQPLAEGTVYDINSRSIVDTLRGHVSEVIELGVVRDNLDLIQDALIKGLTQADLVVLSGGSSLGGEDFMVEAVQTLGTVHVHGIAAKPGKPVLIGSIDGKLVLGLPGYPTSALSNTYTLVLPALYRMMGAKYVPVKTMAKLSRKIASTIGRFEFLAVKLEGEHDAPSAVPVMKGSSAITTMATADGYICIDENTEVVEKDTLVEVCLF
jgi:molybdopterin molybdotransferase